MDKLLKELIDTLKNRRDNDHGWFCTIDADLLGQAIVELQRLSDLDKESQSYGETYGRRSGGLKEVLFK